MAGLNVAVRSPQGFAILPMKQHEQFHLVLSQFKIHETGEKKKIVAAIYFAVAMYRLRIAQFSSVKSDYLTQK